MWTPRPPPSPPSRVAGRTTGSSAEQRIREVASGRKKARYLAGIGTAEVLERDPLRGAMFETYAAAEISVILESRRRARWHNEDGAMPPLPCYTGGEERSRVWPMSTVTRKPQPYLHLCPPGAGGMRPTGRRTGVVDTHVADTGSRVDSALGGVASNSSGSGAARSCSRGGDLRVTLDWNVDAVQ